MVQRKGGGRRLCGLLLIALLSAVTGVDRAGGGKVSRMEPSLGSDPRVLLDAGRVAALRDAGIRCADRGGGDFGIAVALRAERARGMALVHVKGLGLRGGGKVGGLGGPGGWGRICELRGGKPPQEVVDDIFADDVNLEEEEEGNEGTEGRGEDEMEDEEEGGGGQEGGREDGEEESEGVDQVQEDGAGQGTNAAGDEADDDEWAEFEDEGGDAPLPGEEEADKREEEEEEEMGDEEMAEQEKEAAAGAGKVAAGAGAGEEEDGDGDGLDDFEEISEGGGGKDDEGDDDEEEQGMKVCCLSLISSHIMY